MELRLEREPSTQTSTPGKLFLNGTFECFTLEDKVREVPGQPVETWKIPKQTAIPAGNYSVGITRSERFSQEASQQAGKPVEVLLPLLDPVPGFSGIRIHPGNTAADTEGCILVGTERPNPDQVLHSRVAFDALFGKLMAAQKGGEPIHIRVVPAAAAAGAPPH